MHEITVDGKPVSMLELAKLIAQLQHPKMSIISEALNSLRTSAQKNFVSILQLTDTEANAVYEAVENSVLKAYPLNIGTAKSTYGIRIRPTLELLGFPVPQDTNKIIDIETASIMFSRLESNILSLIRENKISYHSNKDGIYTFNADTLERELYIVEESEFSEYLRKEKLQEKIKEVSIKSFSSNFSKILELKEKTDDLSKPVEKKTSKKQWVLSLQEAPYSDTLSITDFCDGLTPFFFNARYYELAKKSGAPVFKAKKPGLHSYYIRVKPDLALQYLRDNGHWEGNWKPRSNTKGSSND